MADQSAKSDAGDNAGAGPYREPPTRAPLWVKVFGLIALVVLVLFVVVLLIGGGEHGPGRHTGPPPGVTHELEP